jgi:hypothetical protein
MGLLNKYSLTLLKDKKRLRISIKAHDTNHAQAQAKDITRAFNGDEFKLDYSEVKETAVSTLFELLAFNKFETKTCFKWKGPFSNNCACVYVLSKRFFVKDIILKYLDIPKESTTAKSKCKNSTCVNPYHFEYHGSKNSKLTGGDLKMLVAYRSQGTGVAQIAEAFNVHRSTIYRNLKNERFSFGAAHNS